MAGAVFSNGRLVKKAGTLYATDTEFEIRGPEHRYVSRGGDKLEGALNTFHIDLTGRTALDVGASTGGFTDCLLQHGCSHVIALDVGYGQLHWKLRNHPRVTCMERTNARNLQQGNLDRQVDLVVMDVSFISLTKIIPPVLSLVEPGTPIVALIKPQFEVGKGEVGKGGVVRDRDKQEKVLNHIQEFVEGLGCTVKGLVQSPLLGPKGNREFFIYFSKKGV